MDILQYSFTGLIAGWFASIVLRTSTFKGIMMDIILGIFGAIAGGVVLYILNQSGVVADTQFSDMGLGMIGATLWIVVGKKLRLI